MKKDLEGEFLLKKEGGRAKLSDPKDDPIGKRDRFVKREVDLPQREAELSQDQSVENTPGFFSSFCEYPTGLSFQNQEAQEKIILLTRRHFITNISWLLLAFLLAALPLFFPLLIRFLGLSLSPSLLTLITLSYYLSLFGFVLVNFSLWYFNISLVTNKRVVDVDVHDILYRHIAETKLDLVEDVSYVQSGVLRSIFDYGDVLVQTAAETPNFEFDKANHPGRVVRIIADLIGKK